MCMCGMRDNSFPRNWIPERKEKTVFFSVAYTWRQTWPLDGIWYKVPSISRNWKKCPSHSRPVCSESVLSTFFITKSTSTMEKRIELEKRGRTPEQVNVVVILMLCLVTKVPWTQVNVLFLTYSVVFHLKLHIECCVLRVLILKQARGLDAIQFFSTSSWLN